MNKYLLALIFSIIVCSPAFSQESLSDTLCIQEVEITEARKKYEVGALIETIDTLHKELLESGSLADAISRLTPIYIKQDAGGLATISIRGTSPDHVAVMFGGINLNSLTLGHSNLSNIPMFLFDDIEIHYGSGSAVYGTDAIGGSLHLNTSPKWTKGTKVVLQQDLASFNSYFTGAKVYVGNGKWESVTKFYRFSKKNDFPFKNLMAYDFEKQEYLDDTTRNAAIENYGLLQEFNYKFSKGRYFTLKAWYDHNYHEIQSNMSANAYSTGSFEDISNESVRVVANYFHIAGKNKVTTSLGYIRDHQIYNAVKENAISTNRAIADVDVERKFSYGGSLKTGLKYAFIVPDVYTYEDGLTEQRADLYVSYQQRLLKKLKVSANLRQGLVTGNKVPFAPSLGFNYAMWRSDTKSLKLRGSIGRSYKIPTFNDRYWGTQGNPDLKPEVGMNCELGTDFNIYQGKNTFKAKLTGYFLDINDWIQWRPMGGDWYPVNIRRVHSSGIETQLKSVIKLKNYTLKLGANYSLNKVIAKEEYGTENKNVGNQLSYTPLHNGNAYFDILYRDWHLNTDAAYTGERFVLEGGENSLQGYALVNMTLGKRLRFQKHIISINGMVYNLFNQEYQNEQFYAMPGRNYRISIRFTFN